VCGGGCGTVFELSPQAGGAWLETQLYVFKGENGQAPEAGLTTDARGNLYGTTVLGGNGAGTVFRLDSQPSGKWVGKVLYDFGPMNDGEDGVCPNTLTVDKNGNVFGATEGGGSHTCQGFQAYCGTVFELSRQSDDTYNEIILHDFQYDAEGYYPTLGLMLDQSGNLYGTTSQNFFNGGGVAFELSPQADGSWMETVLYTFGTKQYDGSDPSGMTFDSTGNLWGATGAGGRFGDGTIFELLPQPGGTWSEVSNGELFQGNRMDGVGPDSGLLMDKHGRFFGVTSEGGTAGTGVVYGFKL
jgi:uncharacterized repeat protein (TIGR03803 family)